VRRLRHDKLCPEHGEIGFLFDSNRISLGASTKGCVAEITIGWMLGGFVSSKTGRVISAPRDGSVAVRDDRPARFMSRRTGKDVDMAGM